jgi:hypothetical protein
MQLPRVRARRAESQAQRKVGDGVSDSKPNVLWASTIFGGKTKKGIVVLSLNDQELVQLEPDNAREFALSVIGAAEAAEQDEFMYRFALQAIGGEREAALLLAEYRKFRALRAARENEPTT